MMLMLSFVMIAVAIIVFAFIVNFYNHPIVQVDGDSMLPTFKDKELLNSRRINENEELKEHNVYVFKSPTGEIVIKRLDHISPKFGLFFIGDNTRCSFDSRSYGYVPRKNVIAEIIYP